MMEMTNFIENQHYTKLEKKINPKPNPNPFVCCYSTSVSIFRKISVFKVKIKWFWTNGLK